MPFCIKIKTDFFGSDENALAFIARLNSITDSVPYFLIIFTSGLFGGISDALGRKPVLLFATLMIFIPHVFLFCHLYFGISLWWNIILSSVLKPLALTTTLFPVVVIDATTNHIPLRPFALSLIGASAAASQIISSLVVQWVDTNNSIALGTSVSLVQLLYTLAILPETHKISDRKPLNHFVGSLSNVLKGLTSVRVILKHDILAKITLVMIIYSMNTFGIIRCTTLYLQTTPWLKFTNQQLALTMLMQGIFGLISAIFIYPPLASRYGLKPTILWGFGILIIGSIFMASAHSEFYVYLASSLGAIGDFIPPSASTMLSVIVAEEDQVLSSSSSS